MSLKIEVNVPETVVVEGKAGGYVDQALGALGFNRAAPDTTTYVVTTRVAEAPPADNAHIEPGAERFPEPTAAPAVAEEPARRKRRTKAEIEADNAAKAGPRANISTGGERVDPENPEDAAQDAADEAAEVEANRDAAAPLTKDDVMAAVMEYSKLYGLPATQEDGPKIFAEALGAPPAGEPYWKFSILPLDDQDRLRKTVETWRKAAELNPLKRAKV